MNGDGNNSGNNVNIVPTIMAQQITLNDALKVVPKYDGDKLSLSVFLGGCQEAKEMISAIDEPNLTRMIRGKLIGEARNSIVGHSFTSIDELKKFLKNIFAKTKTVVQLEGELGQEFQRSDEFIITYAN